MLLSTIWYYLDEHWENIGDPRVKDWTLLSGGLWKILFILSIYLMTVLVLIPQYMKHRRPYVLKNALLVYNFFMVVANAYFFIIILTKINYGKIFLEFDYPSTNDNSHEVQYMLNVAWYLMLTRYIDLADTIFFALRKKQSQITFLHLYHHTIVPIVCWVCFKYNVMIPFLRLLGMLNTLVHVFMYAYYALSAMGPRIQKYLWWKKYLTSMQIIQFVIDLLYGIILYFKQTNYPLSWFWFVFGQIPYFLVMFIRFYIKAYNEKSANARKLSNGIKLN